MNIKQCIKCKRELPIENFSKKGKGRQKSCKECHATYHKEWYEKNKKKRREQIIERKKQGIEFFKNYKKILRCEICGENHPATLDFHHKNTEEKDFNISTAIISGHSIERILGEIEKCTVLCSNCHRKIHYQTKTANQLEDRCL